jgi:hypothetical protein
MSYLQIANSDIAVAADVVFPNTRVNNDTENCVALSAESLRAVAMNSVRDPSFDDNCRFGSVLRVGTAADVQATNAVGCGRCGRFDHFYSAGFASHGFFADSANRHAVADRAAAGSSVGSANHVVAVDFSVDSASHAAAAAGFAVDPATFSVAERVADPAADVVDSVARCAVAVVAAERVAGPAAGAVDSARCAVAVVAERVAGPAAGAVDSARCAVAAAERVVGPAADVADSARCVVAVVVAVHAADSAVADRVVAAPAVSVPVFGLNLDVAGRLLLRPSHLMTQHQ